jgi:hypothetical protein
VLRGGDPDLRTSPVFGCPLNEPTARVAQRPGRGTRSDLE